MDTKVLPVPKMGAYGPLFNPKNRISRRGVWKYKIGPCAVGFLHTLMTYA